LPSIVIIFEAKTGLSGWACAVGNALESTTSLGEGALFVGAGGGVLSHASAKEIKTNEARALRIKAFYRVYSAWGSGKTPVSGSVRLIASFHSRCVARSGDCGSARRLWRSSRCDGVMSVRSPVKRHPVMARQTVQPAS